MSGPVAPPRFVVPTSVELAEDSASFGKIRNISVTGVFIETSQRVPRGYETEAFFRIGDVDWRVRMRVVRHAPDGMGMEFVDVGNEFLRAVMRLVANAPLADCERPDYKEKRHSLRIGWRELLRSAK